MPSVGFVAVELFSVVYSSPLCVILEFFVLFADYIAIFFEATLGLLDCAAVCISMLSSISWPTLSYGMSTFRP